jgi:glutamine amidotransferase
MTLVHVVDLRISNVQSVLKAVQRLGVDACVATNGSDLSDATRIIIPGVGSFAHGARQLEALSLRESLVERALSGASILGICLGMQLLFPSSEEAPGQLGLGLFSGEVSSLPANSSRIGWDRVQLVHTRTSDTTRFSVVDGDFFYFNHNFYAKPAKSEDLVMVTEGPTFVTAVVSSRNITGVQFHPERSQGSGLKFMRAWLERADPA